MMLFFFHPQNPDELPQLPCIVLKFSKFISYDQAIVVLEKLGYQSDRFGCFYSEFTDLSLLFSETDRVVVGKRIVLLQNMIFGDTPISLFFKDSRELTSFFEKAKVKLDNVFFEILIKGVTKESHINWHVFPSFFNQFLFEEKHFSRISRILWTIPGVSLISNTISHKNEKFMFEHFLASNPLSVDTLIQSVDTLIKGDLTGEALGPHRIEPSSANRDFVVSERYTIDNPVDFRLDPVLTVNLPPNKQAINPVRGDFVIHLPSDDLKADPPPDTLTLILNSQEKWNKIDIEFERSVEKCKRIQEQIWEMDNNV